MTETKRKATGVPPGMRPFYGDIFKAKQTSELSSSSIQMLESPKSSSFIYLNIYVFFALPSYTLTLHNIHRALLSAEKKQ